MAMNQYGKEIANGERFAFGANWARFLNLLSESRIREAEDSLRKMLHVSDLNGKTFLDIGSGSGLFSLAARRLGASVHSFDYDPESVTCTEQLRSWFFPNDESWKIERGSILDEQYIRALPKFDIVYSWGVLHHTGDMWHAIENSLYPLNEQGSIYIALYNDQGHWSMFWHQIKRFYNSLPRSFRLCFVFFVMIPRDVKSMLFSIITFRPMRYVQTWTESKNLRGMSKWIDMIDWVGGYPFEVTTPGKVVAFFRERGFILEKLVTCAGSIGCNEFVFSKHRIDSIRD
jgi:2-polyprenyl-6-hydroxyphenyl methylase/3-demethylubiquinone-9 3-methyltransferase